MGERRRAADVRAVTASAVNCDIASMYDTLMGVIRTASPDKGYPRIPKAMAGFESEAELRVRDDARHEGGRQTAGRAPVIS